VDALEVIIIEKSLLYFLKVAETTEVIQYNY